MMGDQLSLFESNEEVKLSDARLSDDGRYRYTLSRIWEAANPERVVFIMLNPSTADANLDDPSVHRLRAGHLQAGGMTVVNLFAYRATDPDALGLVASDSGAETLNGPGNDIAILDALNNPKVKTVVCAWGAHAVATTRAPKVLGFIPPHLNIVCLGVTKDGHPKHPLYLPKSSQPRPFGPCDKYPSTGITGPGQWGSKDGLSWTCVADGELLVGPKNFLMGYIVETPKEARVAMSEGMRSSFDDRWRRERELVDRKRAERAG